MNRDKQDLCSKVQAWAGARWGRRGTLAILVLAASLTVGCQTPTVTIKAPGYELSIQSGTATVVIPAGYTTHFQPKNSAGEPVGKRSQLSGPGTYTIPVPATASGFDATTAESSPPAPTLFTGDVTAAPGAAGLGGFGLGPGYIELQAQVYDVHRLWVPEPNLGLPGMSLLRCEANSMYSAESLTHAVLEAGSGAPLPEAVTVGYLIETEVVSGMLQVRSSLPERFDTFSISHEGDLLADLSTGLNVHVVSEGNGWVTLVAELHATALQPGIELLLSQAGRSQDEPVTVTVKF
ncbi:MAG: hypothetical protein ACT4PU_06895 [Planctomycetota bacterium]